MMFGDKEHNELLREQNRILKEQADALWCICNVLHRLIRKVPNGVQINQIIGGMPMAGITGANVGGSNVFEADALLSGVADPAGFPSGTTYAWSTDDPNVALSAASNPNQVTTTVPSTDTQGTAPAGSPGSFNLSVSVQLPTPSGGTAPAPLTATVNVPLIPAPVPVPTGVTINQIS